MLSGAEVLRPITISPVGMSTQKLIPTYQNRYNNYFRFGVENRNWWFRSTKCKMK